MAGEVELVSVLWVARVLKCMQSQPQARQPSHTVKGEVQVGVVKMVALVALEAAALVARPLVCIAAIPPWCASTLFKRMQGSQVKAVLMGVKRMADTVNMHLHAGRHPIHIRH